MERVVSIEFSQLVSQSVGRSVVCVCRVVVVGCWINKKASDTTVRRRRRHTFGRSVVRSSNNRPTVKRNFMKRNWKFVLFQWLLDRVIISQPSVSSPSTSSSTLWWRLERSGMNNTIDDALSVCFSFCSMCLRQKAERKETDTQTDRQTG